ncbi:MAG: hypothetical protein ACE5EA_10280 [Nitrospirota bacterium]
MFRKLIFIFWMGVAIAWFMPIGLFAKPTAPVSIEYSVPKNIQRGEEVSTVIRFVAQVDMESMEVSVTPYEGLEIVSSEDKTVFLKLKKGEAREFTVRIRLTDPEVGYLSVFATTTTSFGRRTKSIAIRYGVPGPATKQKLKSDKVLETSEGERLYLFHGDPR